jgi:hypothetical protein
MKIYGEGEWLDQKRVFARPGAGASCTSVSMPAGTKLSPWN